ncbi:hypothetical protein WT24_12880 [Burkholderia sp. MSMB1078WGS]|nr:hypothetical protein WT24_12880 [Burkholderia sp. MSMB1078WGS]
MAGKPALTYIVAPPMLLAEDVILAADALFDFERADLEPVDGRNLDNVIGDDPGKRFCIVQVFAYTDSAGPSAPTIRFRRALRVA